MEQIAQQFKTADIWLASALSINLKIEPTCFSDNGKILFSFPLNAKTLKAYEEVTSGKFKFDYFSYSEQVKKLRSKMLILKINKKEKPT